MISIRVIRRENRIVIRKITKKVSIQARAKRGLKGPPGADGATGPQGPQGIQGIPGQDGADGLVQSVVAGTNVTVDNTDPANPVVNSQVVGGVSSVNGQTGDVVVTKSDVGLSNVPNLNTTTAVSQTHTHANKTLLDSYAQTEVDIASAVTQRHSHTNKSILDATTASFSTADESKLDDIAPGAQVNNISNTNATDLTDGGDSTLHYHATDRARANHTGSQAISTVTGLQTALDGKEPTQTKGSLIQGANVTLTGTLTNRLVGTGDVTISSSGGGGGGGAVDSVNGQTGVVVLDQDDVADGATYKQYSQTEKTKLAGIAIGAQVNTVTSVASKTGAVSLVKGDVGLGNVDNTSDASKPVSTLTQAALDNKPDYAELADVAYSGLKADVGLSNADNTSDATKNSAVATLTNKDLTSGTNTFPTFNQNTTGSAAKLTTPRNINGIAFDGTADITVADSTKVPTTTTVNGHALSSNVTVTADDVLPTQTGQNGKFLTTNGSTASWGTPSGGGSTDVGLAMRQTPVYFWDYHAAGAAASGFPTTAIASGSSAYNNTVAGRPGVVSITSSTTANSGMQSSLFNSTTSKYLEGGEIYECSFKLDSISPGNFVKMGMFNNYTTAVTNGAWIEMDASQNLTARTAKASTTTTSSTLVTITSTTAWYRVRIVVNSNATQVDYYVYDAAGTQIATTSITTNIPDTSANTSGYGFVGYRTNAGTAVAIASLDYQYVQFGTSGQYSLR